MNQVLAKLKLKDGTPMEVRVVVAPDPEYGEAIVKWLGHKGAPWIRHLGLVFAGLPEEGNRPGLECRFYLGLIDGQIAGNVSTFEGRGCGILGHVFTTPAHRRRGVCTNLMKVVMDDVRGRGIRAMTLGTTYNSPAYHIYESFGFRAVIAGSGSMRWEADEGFIADAYTAAPARWREPRWSDWPAMSVLFSIGEGDWIRNVEHRRFGPTDFEEGFLRDRMNPDTPGVVSCVLETTRGGIVGYARVYPEKQWSGLRRQLDFFTHPAFREEILELRQCVPWPAGKMQTCAATRDLDIIGVLQRAAFVPEATLHGLIASPWGPLDVLILATY